MGAAVIGAFVGYLGCAVLAGLGIATSVVAIVMLVRRSRDEE